MKLPTDIKIYQKSTILALTAITLFVVGYLPVFQILVKKWASSDEYSHAFLTLPIIIFMVWRKRSVLAEGPVRYSFAGLLVLIFSIPLYSFALLTEVHTVIALSMFLTVVGAVIYLAGAASLKELATPFLLLLLLIPVPDQLYIQITFPLQLKVSQISEILIRLFGVTILREGNVMHIPDRSFEVVEACSGLRSMITLLTLSLIMGYFMLQNITSKIVLVVASVPTAIFVNIIRVSTMIVLFHFFKLDLSVGTLHTLTGLVIFGIALGILFILLKLMELWETKSKKS